MRVERDIALDASREEVWELVSEPDVDEVYDHIVRLMQDTIEALAAERRFPVIG